MLAQANNAIASFAADGSFITFDFNVTWDRVRDLDLIFKARRIRKILWGFGFFWARKIQPQL